MYAVIATGGKQYRVAEGDVVRFEKLEAEPGAAVEFDRILVVGQGADVRVGKPYVAGSKVTGTVQAHGKGDKVRIVKFRRRKHYLRMKNHRQLFTEVKVTEIVLDGTQESRRQHPQRPRVPQQAPRREEIRR